MWVDVYDEKYRVNLRTGKNFDKVISKVEGLILKVASKYAKSFRYLTFEEVKQELVIMTINALHSYDRSRRVECKFSTFLTVHLENKMISLVRHDRMMGHNASYISNEGYSTELPLYSMVGEAFKKRGRLNERSDSIEDCIPDGAQNLYRSDISPVGKMEVEISLTQVLNKNAKKYPLECDVIYRMYFNGETIKECSKDYEISPWAISCRLKKRMMPKMRELKVPTFIRGDFEWIKPPMFADEIGVTVSVPEPERKKRKQKKSRSRKLTGGISLDG